MARIREDFSGGLVTSKLPDQMEPGECQRLDNLIYVPGTKSPRTPPTRQFDDDSTQFSPSFPAGLVGATFDFVVFLGSTSASSTTVTKVSGSLEGISTGLKVYGDNIAPGTTVSAVDVGLGTITLSKNAAVSGIALVYCQASNYLVAQDPNTSTYRLARIGVLNTFVFDTTLDTVQLGDTLECVHYGNEVVLLNGANENRVLKANKATRSHGMKPVIGSPDAVTTSTGGAWVLDTGTGIYSYWTTEVDKSNVIRHPDGSTIGDGLESTFEGKPSVVNVLTSSYFVTVKRPTQLNVNATHWRLYRSRKMSATTLDQATDESVFPDGFLVGEAEMKSDGTQDTIIDGALSFSSQTSVPTTSIPTTDLNQGPVTWVIPGTNWAENNIYATVSPSGLAIGSLVYLRLGNFGFNVANITPPVTGIVIRVQGKRTGGTPPLNQAFDVTPVIYRNGFPIVGTTRRNVTFTTSDTEYSIPSSGGTDIKTDLWGLSNVNASDFADGSFGVEIRVGRCNVTTFDLDTVKVVVYHNKGKQSSTLGVFPAIVVSSFGVETAIGRDGPPPVSSVGDVFQDSLVLNDVRKSNTLRYSFPTKLDSFPRPYYLNFETREQDRITNIKTIGNVCIVGMARQIHRINYLPRETDSEFDRGRAIELVEGGHGIVGVHAACLVNLPGSPQQLAYVSQYGLHITDGYRTQLVSGDLNWARLGGTNMEKCILINNPSLYTLEMYFPQGAATCNNVMYFSYHPDHIKRSGQFKVSGPQFYPVWAVTRGWVSGSSGSVGTKIFSSAGSGFIEYETCHTEAYDYLAGWYADNTDAGGVGGGGTPMFPAIRTRRFPLAGPGKEWRVKQLHLGYSGDDQGGTLPTPIKIITDYFRVNEDFGSTAETTFTTITSTSPTMLSAKAVQDQLGEGMEFLLFHTATNSETPMSYDYLMIEGEDFGEEEHD